VFEVKFDALDAGFPNATEMRRGSAVEMPCAVEVRRETVLGLGVAK